MINNERKKVEHWTTTSETREPGVGALLFRGSVVLEIGSAAGNMRKAARLASLLNRHGVVIAKLGEETTDTQVVSL